MMPEIMKMIKGNPEMMKEGMMADMMKNNLNDEKKIMLNDEHLMKILK
jgi:hypothetical protein